MKQLLFILFFSFSNFCLNAQELIFGDSLVPEKGIVSYQMPDGSFWVIGGTGAGPLGGGDVFTVRVDINGTIITPFAYYGTPNYDSPNNMIYKNGELIIAGETHDANGVDGFVLIMDTSGLFSSFQVYGLPNQTEQFYDIQETRDGGFVVTGIGATVSSAGTDFLISKFDSKYNQRWVRIHDFGTVESGMVALERPDGGFTMIGDHLQPFGGFNVGVIGLDSMGFLEWTKVISYPYNGGCKTMTRMGNQLLVVGEMATATSTYFDIYLARIDYDGNTLWQGIIPGTDEGDAAFDVLVTGPNEFLVTGYSYGDTSTKTDLFVMAVDTNGTVLNEKRYDNGRFEMGYDIKLGINGNYYVTGFAEYPDNQIYLIWDTFAVITPTIKLEEKTKKAPTLFPNPTTGLTWVSGDFTAFDIEIVDYLGRNHFYQKQGQALDLSALANGTYFVVFRNKKGEVVHCDKLVKQ